MTQYSSEEISSVMQARNLDRKGAVQFLRRQRNKGNQMLLTNTAPASEVTAAPEQESNAHKAVEELETLPPAQAVTPVETVAPVAEEAPITEAVTAKRRPRNTAFDITKAIELYKAGTKVVDIAVALGYVHGQGQNRVRTALKSAGVYVEKSTATETPVTPAAA